MRETNWLQQFERAAVERNPVLATKLRPGLSEDDVQSALKKAKVSGDLDPIVALYGWKDGMDLSFEPFTGVVPDFYESEKAKRKFFAGDPLFFLCLKAALADFACFKEIAKNYPAISEAVGRYFPLFWNGSTEWLVTDIGPSNDNRVLIIDHRSDRPVREAYKSFAAFIEDAIAANRENRPLCCFQSEQSRERRT